MSLEKVTDTTFDEIVLKSSTPTVVDFWAEWCGPCRALMPVLEEASAELGSDAQIVKLNIDENPEKAGQYGVRGIPTLMLFKNGELVQTHVGSMPKSKIIEWVKSS
ncbi:MAG: thioredoxin [Alphaproteobacteria bacterium]|nr:MAG: thioredoxin [Alphaproteobacteria bacterium]